MSIYIKAITPTHLVFEDHALSILTVLEKAVSDRVGDYESLYNLEAQLEYVLADVRSCLGAEEGSKLARMFSRLKMVWSV